ncbi:MAG: NAD-dependent protein deacylase [Bacilli bacterium]|nr:NAD-dependent protein deacylase [Bacilli bacterium]
MDKITKLKEIIDNNSNIVLFTGAGVSTESGIKDFRSKDGLYNTKYKFPPEEILSHTFFLNNTSEFYRFYKDKLDSRNINPNSFHKYLKELEDDHKLKAIITQNIDGLHTKVGNTNVYEIHGSIYRNRCMKCGKSYDVDKVFNSKDVPKCNCGGIIKPDVVLYEEELDSELIYKSIDAISNADVLIVAGTSLTVYPASSFIRYFKGKNMILINRDSTPYDNIATLVINDELKNVVKKLKETK